MELERFGKYELLERLGRGGMGEVWKARDTQLQRFVAIKLLHADLESQPDFVARFMREARFVASLRHPNIVQIHDFELTGVAGSRVRAYMVMDYIEGGTLADYIHQTIRRGFYLPASALVDLFASTGLALDYAHQRGMIHRDIKPANILLDRPRESASLGEPILSDFGIARLQDASSSTVSYALVGTPLYISPEQAEGRTLSERSDLYSLGIVLYEMLTGATPFHGDRPIAIMMQHVHQAPQPPAQLNPRINQDLSAVVLRSIAKDPQDRFPSAAAMTIAMAQAMNIPLPANLGETRSIGGQSAFNPLQPTGSMPGHTPQPPTLIVSPSPETLPPTVLTPQLPVPQAVSQTPLPAPKPPARSRRRWLFVAAIACVLIALVGVSAFTVLPGLLNGHAAVTPTTAASDGVVGHITFGSTTPGSTLYNQLRIDISPIAPPPAGSVYYAWLGNTSSNNEVSIYPHWPLQVVNGAVHGLFTSTSSTQPHTNLLTSSNWFLVTAEQATSTPIVPLPSPTAHLYYALIPHASTSSTTFEVRPCPTSGQSVSPCA
jgi:serine/threonine protein kinase